MGEKGRERNCPPNVDHGSTPWLDRFLWNFCPVGASCRILNTSEPYFCLVESRRVIRSLSRMSSTGE